ncbi:3-hydroxybenzoate 6-monooxygenase [Rhodobacteraceae bacterium N5(2021)]|uniref:3-hydroxybenzoate 6-monooxygenase n=1 Tax=Gymnodinialimonas phycosphaerae TaxID=2841589 RepID=A0A975YHF4_9RHOB|nr:3-hydroxybenzoate 6-monooxygenase [Gymnodinialimonas phycosphaerae]MBY4892741.1 3-hydroxybenzoate 6-monooxygenase [Gymnodinialimonas phycosphaerae]
MTLPILIAGGGIGGLAAAAALAGKGIASIVLEQAPTMAEIGAGIQIGPNGFHCFDALGIGAQMRETAVFIDALRLLNAQTAEEITRIPLDAPFRAHFGNPYAVVHRAQLHQLLLQRCIDSGLVDLRTQATATGYSQDGTSVTLHLADGAVRGRALIGAEGLRSPVRAQMLGDGAPRVSGHTTYRSVIPRDAMPEDLRMNAATLWAGPKCHIVHYPLKGGTVFNLVVTYHRDALEAVSGKPVTNAEVAEGFEHVHPRARAVIEHGRDWKQWVLCDRDPVSRWTDGRVALLGDAAHPMLQYFAQGACMAMEDGVALAVALDGAEDVEVALTHYQDMRATRTARVQMNSRLIGDYIYHPDDARAAVRNEIMQGMSPQDWYTQLTWIYKSNGLPLEMGGI